MPSPTEEFAEALKQKSAPRLGVERLYRFQPFDAARLALALGMRVLRASNPRYFNDPFDCSPLLSSESLPPEAVDDFMDVVASFLKMSGQPSPSPQQWAETRSRLKVDQNYRAARMIKFSESLFKMVRHFRIICVCGNAFNPLLWSHYADAHRGMCLEFNSTIEPFSRAAAINYVPQYPQIALSKAKLDSLLEISLLTKAKWWEYEQEFRLIATDVQPSPHLKCEQDLIELPPNSLTAIICGHRCPQSSVEEARQLINRFAPHVELYAAVRQPGNYELGSTRLDTKKSIEEQFKKRR
jgi:hypothetical protein